MMLALLAGCGGRQAAGNSAPNATAPASNTAQTSVEDLGLLINIPYEAEDAVWKENKAAKKLTAILRFDQQDTAKIVAEAEKTRPPQPVTVPAETWFPADLTTVSDTRGDDEIAGKAYAADQFFQGDYMDGRLIRVDGNDYFILELNSK